MPVHRATAKVRDAMSEQEAEVPAGLRGLGRAGWNLADQVLSALTNFALSLIVARNVSAEAFGQFSVAFLVFSLMIGVQRALVGLPLNIRFSKATGSSRVDVAHRALAAVLWITLPISAALLVFSAFLPDNARAPWLALAILLPFLITQDICRMMFLAWGKPQLATLNDAIWAVAQFGLIALLLSRQVVSAASMIAAWGIAAGVAAAVGLVQLRALPRFRSGLDWLKSTWGQSKYLLSNYVLDVGTFQGGILLFGFYLGVSDIGAIRAAQVLTGPLAVVAVAASTFAIPEISRRGLPPRPMAVAGVLSAIMVTVSLLYVTVLLLVPSDVGTQLLGDTWTGARTVLLPVAMTAVVSAAKLGPTVLVFGLGHTDRTTRLILTLAISGVAFMLVGAVTFGVLGLAWGMCAAQAVVVPLWFLEARRSAALGPVDFGDSASK